MCCIVLLAGPEYDIDEFASNIDKDIRWDVTGVGYGMRGTKIPEVLTRFEGKPSSVSIELYKCYTDFLFSCQDNLMVFRKETPKAQPVFNINADSFLWSVQRRFPLARNCTGSPGTLYVRLLLQHIILF